MQAHYSLKRTYCSQKSADSMPTFPSADDPGLYNRPLPTPAEVGRYLGISPDAEQVESLKLHIDNSVQAVFAYTRALASTAR